MVGFKAVIGRLLATGGILDQHPDLQRVTAGIFSLIASIIPVFGRKRPITCHINYFPFHDLATVEVWVLIRDPVNGQAVIQRPKTVSVPVRQDFTDAGYS